MCSSLMMEGTIVTTPDASILCSHLVGDGNRSFPLLSLPVEVQEMVFYRLHCVDDVVNFSLVCRCFRLMTEGESFIRWLKANGLNKPGDVLLLEPCFEDNTLLRVIFFLSERCEGKLVMYLYRIVLIIFLELIQFGITLKLEYGDDFQCWRLVKEDDIMFNSDIIEDFSELDPHEPWTRVEVGPLPSYFVAVSVEQRGRQRQWGQGVPWILPLDRAFIDCVALRLSPYKAVTGHVPVVSVLSKAIRGSRVCLCKKCYGDWWTGSTIACNLSEFDRSAMRLRLCCKFGWRSGRGLLPRPR